MFVWFDIGFVVVLTVSVYLPIEGISIINPSVLALEALALPVLSLTISLILLCNSAPCVLISCSVKPCLIKVFKISSDFLDCCFLPNLNPHASLSKSDSNVNFAPP